jgi:hypothetical protein
VAVGSPSHHSFASHALFSSGAVTYPPGIRFAGCCIRFSRRLPASRDIPPAISLPRFGPRHLRRRRSGQYRLFRPIVFPVMDSHAVKTIRLSPTMPMLNVRFMPNPPHAIHVHVRSMVLATRCHEFVLDFIDRVSSCLGQSLCIAADLFQGLLFPAQRIHDRSQGYWRSFCTALDGFTEFFVENVTYSRRRPRNCAPDCGAKSSAIPDPTSVPVINARRFRTHNTITMSRFQSPAVNISRPIHYCHSLKP